MPSKQVTEVFPPPPAPPPPAPAPPPAKVVVVDALPKGLNVVDEDVLDVESEVVVEVVVVDVVSAEAMIWFISAVDNARG
jgi:hypothetical protein